MKPRTNRGGGFRSRLLKVKNKLLQTKFSQEIFQRGVTVFCCVGIIVFGITLLSKADPITTSIGQDISTNNLSLSGSVTSGTWAGSSIDVAHGGTGQDWSAATQGSLPFFSGTGALSALTPGLAGQFLQSGGSGANPSWGNVTRSATFVIAAFNSSVKSKQQADYVCDGTDDQVEIQVAINALPANGGSILLLEGTYILSSIFLRPNDVLMGQGELSILKANSVVETLITMNDKTKLTNLSVDCDSQVAFGVSVVGDYIDIENILVENTTQDGILVGGNVKDVHDIKIDKIRTFNTGTDKGSGVEIFKGAFYVVISDSIARNFSDVGFDVHDHAGEHSPHDVLIKNCIADTLITGDGSDLGNGIAAYSQIAAGNVYNVSIDNCIIKNVEEGIYINNVFGFSVTGNKINNILNFDSILLFGENKGVISNNYLDNNNSNGRGIYQTSSNGSYIISNNVIRRQLNYGMWIAAPNTIISGNTIEDIGSAASGYGIRLKGTNARIMNNNFISINLNGIWVDGGSGRAEGNMFSTTGASISGSLVAKNNTGYATENSGTSTITASQTSVTITHGLAATPTRVQLTPTTLTGGKDYYISAKTATTFTITIDSAHSADITFDWRGVVGEGN